MAASWVLFETTESVIEVLWDIALAFFVIRIAFFYFLLNLLTGAATLGALAYYLELHTSPTPTHHPLLKPLLTASLPILLASSALWARYVVRKWQVPRVLAFRLATGAMASWFMLLTGLVVALGMYEEGVFEAAWVWKEEGWADLKIWVGMLVVYALMPTLLMFVERRLGRKGEEVGEWEGNELGYGAEKKMKRVGGAL